jgi:hypothetical protein
MPFDPLGYCSYDLVLLVKEGFTQLRGGQLDAVRDWVHAGGSLCVVPPSAGLGQEHLLFLNQMSRAEERQAPYLVDGDGRLVAPATAQGPKSVLARYGLGRAAVLHGSWEQLIADEAEQARLQAFLWKLRADAARRMGEVGKWLPAQPMAEEQQRLPQDWNSINFRRTVNDSNSLFPEPIHSGDQILEQLRPRDLRMLPLPLVGLLLLGYLFLIGPVDYVALGLLRLRKWTWVLFPLVTAVVTLLTVGLSHWYMRTQDNQRAVVFIDVGDANRIARINRFELQIHGTAREVQTEVNRGLFTAMDHRRFGSGNWFNYNYGAGGRGDAQHERAAPVLVGRVPAAYTAIQRLPQWSPQLNRIFMIPRGQTGEPAISPMAQAASGTAPRSPGQVPSPAFDWTQFEGPAYSAAWARQAAGLNALRDAVAQSGAFPGLEGIFVITAEGVHSLPAWPALFADGVPRGDARLAGSGPYVNSGPSRVNAFLEDVSLFAPTGLYRVVSQLSPHGGGDYSDMAVLDRSDPAQWMLVVAARRGKDLLIYRKLYRRWSE